MAVKRFASRKNSRYKQGVFSPQNPAKYKGDPTQIFYRSSLELRVMQFLDTNPTIITWSSEERFIPYRSPIDCRMHRYYADFIIETLNEKVMIEVKPASQCKPPKKPKKVSKAYVEAVKTYGINQAKWEAARQYCLKHDMRFQLLTEEDIFPKRDK